MCEARASAHLRARACMRQQFDRELQDAFSQRGIAMCAAVRCWTCFGIAVYGHVCVDMCMAACTRKGMSDRLVRRHVGQRVCIDMCI